MNRKTRSLIVVAAALTIGIVSFVWLSGTGYSQHTTKAVFEGKRIELLIPRGWTTWAEDDGIVIIKPMGGLPWLPHIIRRWIYKADSNVNSISLGRTRGTVKMRSGAAGVSISDEGSHRKAMRHLDLPPDHTITAYYERDDMSEEAFRASAEAVLESVQFKN